jgi:hypothetical protein
MLLARVEAIRTHATVAMKLADTSQQATSERPHTPKLCFVARSASYVASDGRPVAADSVDLLARAFSVGGLAQRDDRRRGSGDRGCRSDARHDCPSCGAVGERWQRAFWAPVVHVPGQRRGVSTGQPLSSDQSDDELVGASADGRIGLRTPGMKFEAVIC